MTRSVVREPDQDNRSEVPVQRCFVPEDTSKIAKNMDSGINGITTRYGRAVKMVHSGDDQPGKQSLKTPKAPELPPVVPSLVHTGIQSKNDQSPEILEAEKIKAADREKHTSEIKRERLPEVPAVEFPESKDYILESVRGIQNESDGQWTVGELAWAHVSNYPYWPCIVTEDPVDDTHLKQKPFGRRIVKMVHVTYFGDNGRHNWVNEINLMKFEGLKHFNDLAASLVKGRKKYAKFYSGFIVKTVIKNKWDIGVTEAEALIPMSVPDRFRAMAPKRKRGRPRLSPESAAKRPRLDSTLTGKSIDDDLETIKSRTKSFDDSNLTAQTPPTPPSSIKDSSDESSSVRKRKRRRRTKAETNEDFEIYYQINKDNKGYLPGGSPEETRQYLRTMWDGMSAYQRSKWKATVDGLHTKEKSSSPDGEVLADESTPRSRKSKGFKEPGKDQSKEQGKEKLEMSLEAVKRPKIANLFKGVKAERVCQICEKTGNLTRCKGPCYSYFHLKCVKPGESESEGEGDEETVDSASTGSGEAQKKSKEDTLEEENFKCIDCLSGVAPACFVCNEREDDRIRCSALTCGKHYHSKCLKMWPQSHWHGGRLTCPYHMCHTCISDNPQNHHTKVPNDKLARCVRCPSAYHASAQCLPAGSQILTSTQVICPKHYVAPHPPLNAAWCFLCTRGGSLICCDTCPTSFHPECLGIDAPDGAFICEDCETGRLPLYGEVVWVKLGNYRWWPSRICYPQEVPSNLRAVAHSPGEFCVMFLGTKNYYWVHRGRVFLYQEGDTCARNSMGRKTVDDAYKQAVTEANELHQQVKNDRVAAKEEESKNLKPPPYVKIRVNKPVGNVKPMEMEVDVACECDPKWEHPCSPDSDCLNRILFTECNPTICPAGSKCNNQCFMKKKYPLMEPFHTVGRGWGLKTLESIKTGQFVVEYVGEVIDEAEYKRRLHRKKEMRNENYYFLTIDNYRTIDAEPKGNLSRFMNHSCQPNCETQKWTVNGDTRIGLFALKDIEQGEELTFNYNLATEGETKKPCLCGASNCSGYIGLKAQKPQQSPVEPVVQEKAEKVEPEKGKKPRRSKKTYKCWSCGEVVSGDNFIECGMKSCPKRYHTKCVKRAQASRFRCPWHHCLDCEKRTSLRCLLCSTAYCQSHLEGKMIERKDKNGYLCKVHENSLGESGRESLGESGRESLRDALPEIEAPDEEAESPSGEAEVGTGGDPESSGGRTDALSEDTPEKSLEREADRPSEKPAHHPEKKNKKDSNTVREETEAEVIAVKDPVEDPVETPVENPVENAAELHENNPGDDACDPQVVQVGADDKKKDEVEDEIQEIDIKEKPTESEEIVVEEKDDIQEIKVKEKEKEVNEVEVMEVVVEDDTKDEVLSIPETKVDSDEDFDTASLLADSDGSINEEDVIPPRVSIIQIDLSDEDDIKQDIKPEDEDIDGMVMKEDILPVSVKRRKTLRNHQTHRMIGGVVPS